MHSRPRRVRRCHVAATVRREARRSLPDRRPGSTATRGWPTTVAAQAFAASGLHACARLDADGAHDRRAQRTLHTVIAQRPGRVTGASSCSPTAMRPGTRARAELSRDRRRCSSSRGSTAPRARRAARVTLVSTSGGSGGAAGPRTADGLGRRARRCRARARRPCLGDVRRPARRRGWSNALGSSSQRLLRDGARRRCAAETGSRSDRARALMPAAAPRDARPRCSSRASCSPPACPPCCWRSGEPGRRRRPPVAARSHGGLRSRRAALGHRARRGARDHARSSRRHGRRSPAQPQVRARLGRAAARRHAAADRLVPPSTGWRGASPPPRAVRRWLRWTVATRRAVRCSRRCSRSCVGATGCSAASAPGAPVRRRPDPRCRCRALAVGPRLRARLVCSACGPARRLALDGVSAASRAPAIIIVLVDDRGLLCLAWLVQPVHRALLVPARARLAPVHAVARGLRLRPAGSPRPRRARRRARAGGRPRRTPTRSTPGGLDAAWMGYAADRRRAHLLALPWRCGASSPAARSPRCSSPSAGRRAVADLTAVPRYGRAGPRSYAGPGSLGGTDSALRPMTTRRLAARLSTVLIVAGALMLVDAGLVTLVWQEPVSAVYAQRSQHELSRRPRPSRGRPGPSRLELRALRAPPTEKRRLALMARAAAAPDGRSRRRARADQIPRPRQANFVVVQGTARPTCARGRAIYPDTPLPGRGRDPAIAGHRTTYLAPFRNLDDLDRGDEIRLEMPYGDFTYDVERRGSSSPRRVGDQRRHPTTASCCPRAIRSTARRSGSSCSRAWWTRGARRGRALA